MPINVISLTINCANRSFGPEAIGELVDQIKAQYKPGETNVITIHAQEDANPTFDGVASAIKGIGKGLMRGLFHKDAAIEISKSTVIGKLCDAFKQDGELRGLVKSTGLITETYCTMTELGKIGSVGIGAFVLGEGAAVVSQKPFTSMELNKGHVGLEFSFIPSTGAEPVTMTVASCHLDAWHTWKRSKQVKDMFGLVHPGGILPVGGYSELEGVASRLTIIAGDFNTRTYSEGRRRPLGPRVDRKLQAAILDLAPAVTSVGTDAPDTVTKKDPKIDASRLRGKREGETGFGVLDGIFGFTGRAIAEQPAAVYLGELRDAKTGEQFHGTDHKPVIQAVEYEDSKPEDAVNRLLVNMLENSYDLDTISKLPEERKVALYNLCKLSQHLQLEYRIEQEQYHLDAPESDKAKAISEEMANVKTAISRCISEPEDSNIYKPLAGLPKELNTITSRYELNIATCLHKYVPLPGDIERAASAPQTPVITPPDTPPTTPRGGFGR